MNGGPAHRRTLALALAVGCLLAIAVRLAWLGDDAYITLRSVENWVRGNGLRWNPSDRVQTYTHPAWMLLLAAGRWLTGELYFTTIALSLGLSTTAIAMLLRPANSAAAVLAAAALLATTRAFTDYTTSGLETPLTFVVLVAFVRVVTDPSLAPAGRFARAVLLTAVAATNRMDLGFLCAPAVLAAMRGLPVAAVVRIGATASLPFLAWLLFATIWYGSPLPVTAHAKAFGTGIAATDLALQGLRYLQFALLRDPVCLLAIGGGLAIGWRGATTRWLALGAACYLAYVVKVGGDFMAGRFLLPPFLVAVAILVPWLARRSGLVLATIALVAIACSLVGGWPAWCTAPGDERPETDAEIQAQWGIGDERRVYHGHLGLLAPGREIPVFGALDALVNPEGVPMRWILLNGAVGAAGFGAGARGHVLDPLLCDPLLTRLPARDPEHWRIGHVLRRIPEGYYETLATGENRLHHPGLRDYYGALRTMTQEPIWSAERWATAWRLLRGDFDAGFRAFVAEDYYRPPRLPVAQSELAPPLPLGSYWFEQPSLRVVYEGGLAVSLANVETARQLRLQAAGFCDFRLRFLRAGVVRGEAIAVPVPMPAPLPGLRAMAGLREELVTVPDTVVDYDEVWIDARENALSHTATGPPVVGLLASLPVPR